MMINDYDHYVQSLNEKQLHEKKMHEETVLLRSLYWIWNKASQLTAFYAWDSSPHLLVTPAQLMRLGIEWNESCIVGDFA